MVNHTCLITHTHTHAHIHARTHTHTHTHTLRYTHWLFISLSLNTASPGIELIQGKTAAHCRLTRPSGSQIQNCLHQQHQHHQHHHQHITIIIIIFANNDFNCYRISTNHIISKHRSAVYPISTLIAYYVLIRHVTAFTLTSYVSAAFPVRNHESPLEHRGERSASRQHYESFPMVKHHTDTNYKYSKTSLNRQFSHGPFWEVVDMHSFPKYRRYGNFNFPYEKRSSI